MTYEARRAVMIEYLQLKVQEFDWHGVSDAANDLREMEAVHLATQVPKIATVEEVKWPNQHE